MNDSQGQADGVEAGIHVGTGPSDDHIRNKVLDCLRHAPQLWQSLRKVLTSSDVYRVVLDADKAHLFKQASDGYFKPYLHNGQHFVGNVNLEKLPPNVLGEISNLLMAVNMAAIAAEMRAIKVSIIGIHKLLSEGVRGEIRGAIRAIDEGRALSQPDERRRQMLGACQHLSIALGKLTAQLGGHLAAMPAAHKGFFQGFLGSGLEEVDRSWSAVRADIVSLREGSSTLLMTFSELGEPEAARVAVSGLVQHLQELDWNTAIPKARLVAPQGDGMPAGAILKEFRDRSIDLKQTLVTRELPLRAITIDLTSEEMNP